MVSRKQWGVIVGVTGWFAISGLASGSVAHFVGQGVAGLLGSVGGVAIYNEYTRRQATA